MFRGITRGVPSKISHALSATPRISGWVYKYLGQGGNNLLLAITLLRRSTAVSSGRQVLARLDNGHAACITLGT